MPTHPALEGVFWRGASLIIGDPEKLKKVARKNLSASVAANVAKCPASHAAGSLLPKISDPMSPAELGTQAHAVLEHLYKLPADERTPEAVTKKIRSLGNAEWATSKLTEQTTVAKRANSELRKRWTEAVTAMAMGDFQLEDPTKVNVHHTELDIRDILIGNNVPFRGFLDRTDIVGEDQDGLLLEIVDYKTGHYSAPNPRFGDNYGDQQRLYAEALAVTEGRRPARARLLYTTAGKQREIDLSAGAIKTTLYGFNAAWETLNYSVEKQSFAAQPSALCAWCPLANACPVAKITSEKAIDQATKQLSAVDLGIPTVPVQSPQPRTIVDPGPAPRIDETSNTEHELKGQTIMSPVTLPNLTKQYPNSEYAAISAFQLVDIATDHLAEHGQALQRENIEAFATVLASLLTFVEREMFTTVGWEHGKHSRLTYGLKGVLRYYPAPFGKQEADWANWKQGAAKFLAAKSEIALNLINAEGFSTDAYKRFLIQAA